MWNSEGASLVSGCDRLFGWSLGYYSGSLLEIRPGVNIGFIDRTLVGLALGVTTKSPLGRAGCGTFKRGEDLGRTEVRWILGSKVNSDSDGGT